MKNAKVLITCGPTWVPIDAMRVISNRSTGTLGHLLAEAFTKAGAKVTLLEGAVAKPLESKAIKVKKFLFFDELASLMRAELKKKYDICVHAAAVSDYKLKSPSKAKLSSTHRSLKLDLVPTPKLVERIKRINPNIFLVAFKLEATMPRSAAVTRTGALFEKAKSDLVIANSARGRQYGGYIVDAQGRILARARSRRAMARCIVKTIKETP